MVGQESLASYFMINFQLKTHHGYDPEWLDNQVPWERALWLSMIEQHVKEENMKMQQQLGTSGVKREFI